MPERDPLGPWIDERLIMRDISTIVDSKKKTLQPAPSAPPVQGKAIRLKPSTTDYATFVATTSKVLGTTGPASRKTKPNVQLLSLVNGES